MTVRNGAGNGLLSLFDSVVTIRVIGRGFAYTRKSHSKDNSMGRYLLLNTDIRKPITIRISPWRSPWVTPRSTPFPVMACCNFSYDSRLRPRILTLKHSSVERLVFVLSSHSQWELVVCGSVNRTGCQTRGYTVYLNVIRASSVTGLGEQSEHLEIHLAQQPFTSISGSSYNE